MRYNYQSEVARQLTQVQSLKFAGQLKLTYKFITVPLSSNWIRNSLIPHSVTRLVNKAGVWCVIHAESGIRGYSRKKKVLDWFRNRVLDKPSAALSMNSVYFVFFIQNYPFRFALRRGTALYTYSVNTERWKTNWAKYYFSTWLQPIGIYIWASRA